MKQNTDKTLTVKQNNFVALSPLSVFYLLQTLLCLSSLSLSKSLHLEHYMHNHIKSCQVSGHTSPFSFQHTNTLNAPVLKPPLIARVLKHTRDISQHSKSTQSVCCEVLHQYSLPIRMSVDDQEAEAFEFHFRQAWIGWKISKLVVGVH